MMAYTLRYAEELRAAKDYFSDIPEQSIDKKQLALANDLIKSQSAPLRLDEYKDDYEAALRELIEARRTQSPLPEVREKPAAKVVNLMDALKRSIDESKAKPTKSKRSAQKGPVLVKSGKRSHKAA
jgi:DNA end-binding protein Ku